jgi:aldose 1-epimerase
MKPDAGEDAMKKRVFGRHDGRAVEEVRLESADASVAILNFGCVVRDWRVDGGGRSLPMVLGFPRLEDYLEHSRSHGAVCGRIAGRTRDARFPLDGRTWELTRNEGANHLHGGATGLGRRVWDMEGDDAAEAVHLRYLSPAGEEGYPGAVEFSVTYRLEGPRLVCEMIGRPDRPTPINLAQHNYYNLGGGGTVRDHVLWIDGPEHVVLREDLIPDGAIRPTAGTHLDFTTARSIEESDPERIGLDNCLLLSPERKPTGAAAWASCPRTGLRLQLWTDEPALQVFDAPRMTIPVAGHEGERYRPFAGLCLEAQHLPDSMNNPDWPSIVRGPDNPYFQRLVVEIVPG